MSHILPQHQRHTLFSQAFWELSLLQLWQHCEMCDIYDPLLTIRWFQMIGMIVIIPLVLLGWCVFTLSSPIMIVDLLVTFWFLLGVNGMIYRQIPQLILIGCDCTVKAELFLGTESVTYYFVPSRVLCPSSSSHTGLVQFVKETGLLKMNLSSAASISLS